MPLAYLHDIPFDTFLKYYLNNENDADTISVNARYQPVYTEETVGTYYLYKYSCTVDTKIETHCIKTIKPMPLDIGAIGKKIYTTSGELLVTRPRLTAKGKELIHEIDRRFNKIRIISDDIFSEIMSLSENQPVFSTPMSEFCINPDPEAPVYYIPIQDVVSDFFDNLSLYPYYGKIKDNIYYSMFSMDVDNVKRFFVRLIEPETNGNDQEGVNYKAIENMESSIRVLTDNIYQDPDYDNIYYYSVINTRTKKEVGKIYCLEPHNILEYNDYNKAHFVDTYKKDGMLNYDLWFDEDDMPISPIMKYHLYMREYKSVLGSADSDPTTDITKYSKTNTLYYKDFSDHGEIGYAYKYSQKATTPIVLTQILEQSPAYLASWETALEPVPAPTVFKEITPIVEKVTQAIATAISNVVNFAEKAIFSNSITSITKKPVATAKNTTIKANAAKKKIDRLVQPMLRGAKRAMAAPLSSGNKHIDLMNVNKLSTTMLDCAIRGTPENITPTVVAKTSAPTTKEIKQTAIALKEKIIFHGSTIENPQIIKHFDEITKSMADGSATYKFFDTRDVYNINILSTATIELNKGVSVSAEAKAITERDHALQKIILDAISGNTETITGTVSTYAALSNLSNVNDGAIYKLTTQDTVTVDGKEVVYAKNTLFKYHTNNGSPFWAKYVSYTYKMPSSGEKDVTQLPNNNIVAISDIMTKTKFFQYRNNIFVMTLDKPNKTVKVRTIYKYIKDTFNEMNECYNCIKAAFNETNVNTEECDPNEDTRTKTTTDFRIANNDIITELNKHIDELNDFEKTDALSKLKRYFNNVKFYEKSSVHSQDRVSENILLDKYKKGFYNVAVNTLLSKESNIYSSSAVTDKFDMYVYVTSLYDNLIKSLTVTPIKNKGGICYDYKNDTSYFGFMNYDSDLVYFNYIKAKNEVKEEDQLNVIQNDALTQEEQTALMHDIESSNYIRRLLNYKQYNLNAEEFNHRYDSELYHRNYKSISDVEDVHQTFVATANKTYREQEFAITDLLDKSITLYTEYLYANNNKNNKDTEDIDSPTSFNRRSLPLYIEKINNYRNIFMLDNDGQYQLKHVFKNTDEDKNLFLESLRQKIDRGE